MKKKLFIGIIILLLAFSAYIWVLYPQVERLFNEKVEYIPTRIYSDLIRIHPPQPRKLILEYLKNLGYSYQTQNDQILFTLHPIQYPTYLIPETHATLEGANKPITLQFDGNTPGSALVSIILNEKEISELFLEPELIATLSSGTKQIRSYTNFQEIPAYIWKAIIAIEDQNFLEHKGFDVKGILRAFWVNLKTLSFAQGGSTITQQLVKNLLTIKTKSIFRKINELFLAILLEIRYDKEKILERYLNEVYLGQVGHLEIHGVTEGAQHFFGKKLNELSLAEIALMAGIIRGPFYYSPYRHINRSLERMKLVLQKMVERGHLAQREATEAMKLEIRLAPQKTVVNKAPYFTDYVKAELIRHLKDKMTEEEIALSGFRIYTTLDARLSIIAEKTVLEGVTQLEKQNRVHENEKLEGALASVDPTTGFIKVLVGGKHYAQSNFNRILNMKRQVGSTFKPFVYLAALTKGKNQSGTPFGPAYPLEDTPWKLTFDRGKQTWSPQNYEKEYEGWTSFRNALAHSLNVATARLGVEVGIQTIIETAKKLGIQSELPNVPSLSLGVAALSPVELLQAYAVIAHHGVQDELTVIRAITYENGKQFARFIYHPKEVYPRPQIDLLLDLLQSVFTDGTAKVAQKLGFDRPAAGKTGTTSHYRDSWFAGFTPDLVTVVWVGFDQEETNMNRKTTVKLTGAGSALPIWVRFMSEALESEPPLAFPQSPYLSEISIDKLSGNLSTSGCPETQIILEKYISGTDFGSPSCAQDYPAPEKEKILE